MTFVTLIEYCTDEVHANIDLDCRIVRGWDELEDGFHGAMSEALKAFGDGSCFIER